MLHFVNNYFYWRAFHYLVFLYLDSSDLLPNGKFAIGLRVINHALRIGAPSPPPNDSLEMNHPNTRFSHD